MSAIPTRSVQIYPVRGMDERWRVEPSRADLVQDMTWNSKDSWRDSYGFREFVHEYPTAEEGTAIAVSSYKALTSIHWFSKHNGSLQYLIWETTQGELRYFNGSLAPTQVHTTIVDRNATRFDGTSSNRSRSHIATPHQGTQSTGYAGRIYMVNGNDEPIVFDGRKAERAGFATAPGAPFVSNPRKSTSADVITIADKRIGAGYRESGGAYRYKVTFVNERGQESPASASSNIVSWEETAEVRRPVHVEIPTGPVETVARRIYRTQSLYDSSGDYVAQSSLHNAMDGFENYYFVKEIPDNVTILFQDITPDPALGSVLIEENLGPFPFNASHIANFKNTVFIAGMTGNEVRFSAPLRPEVFPDGNQFQVGDSTLGPVTGLYATKNALVVFKSRAIYLIKGSPSSGFHAQTLTLDIGCSATNSVAELPGVGLAFLSESGIYVLQGALENTGTPTGIINISATIPDTMARLNWAGFQNASATVNLSDKEYLLSVPEYGKPDPTLLIKYHYEIGEWSISDNWPISCMVSTADHRSRVVFGSWNDIDHPGIHVISHGWEDKGGDASIGSIFKTSHLDFGSAVGPIAPLRVSLYAVGYGNNEITCNAAINRETSSVYEAPQSHQQRYPYENLPVYGSAKWGESGLRWVSPRPIVIRFDLSTSHKDMVHELQLSFAAAKRRIEIIGLEIEVKSQSVAIGAKPLTLNMSSGGMR